MEDLEQTITSFLAIQSINHSTQWKEQMIKGVLRLNRIDTQQAIRDVYQDMTDDLFERGRNFLRAEYPFYPESDIKDIFQNGFMAWFRTFDPAKSTTSANPELLWLLKQLNWQQIAWHYKMNPILGHVEKLDEDGNPVLTVKGKKIYDKVYARMVKIVENAYDTLSESDEENTSADWVLPDTDTISISSEDNHDQQDEYGQEETTDDVVDPSAQIPLLEDEPPAKSITFSDGQQKVTFKTIAAWEVIRHLLIVGRIKKISRNSLPVLTRLLHPTQKSIREELEEGLHNLSDATRFHHRRLAHLKNAHNRKWMEMAIAQMKKSKVKLDAYISDELKKDPGFEEKDFREKTPILSAILLDSNGNQIATCFKGQVDDTDGDKPIIRFDKHCEYSLFTEVLGEKNMAMAKDGTLFVTLEPCNKRGTYWENGMEKPKIACAVRCVEAGIKNVFIGSVDENKMVYKKGEAILNSGQYVFELTDGHHAGSQKEQHAAKLLEEYFRDQKGYPATRTKDAIIYTIGQPAVVRYFDYDLIEKVRRINAVFLNKHNEQEFSD